MSLLRDIRYGFRSLRTSLPVTTVAVLALTLGIALTTTMFSIVYGALMRGLPFEEGDRIMVVRGADVTRGARGLNLSVHDYAEYAAQQRSFEGLAAYYSGTVNVSGTERAERFDGAFVSANTFALLRVPPVLGRSFADEETRAGGAKVAVLGYRMWQDRFAGRREVIGEQIRANGVPHTIIGVMPEGFVYPDRAALWLPLQADLAVPRGQGQGVEVMGRLRPGVTIDQAAVDLNVVARRLANEFKETNEHITASVRSFVDANMGDEPRQLLTTMLGAVFLVLLIACANVANLLLDRAAHRTKEVGIRTALGASRGAVIRQFLVEALALSLVATVLGVIVAWFAIGAFKRSIVDTDVPFFIDIRLHPPVLLFAAAVAILTTLLSGAIPAVQSARADINEILKDESRGASSFRIGRLSKGLVIFEIALSCALLVAAGLTVRSVTNVRNMDPGFATTQVFTARVGFPTGTADSTTRQAFFDAIESRLAAIPGVQAAAVSSGLPAADTRIGGSTVEIEGVSYATPRERPDVRVGAVSPGFFSTLALPILRGRGFTAADRDGSLPVVVVNERFVSRFFPGADPIGRRIRLGSPGNDGPWATIVGIVPVVFNGDIENPRPAMVFRPFAQAPVNFAYLSARTAGAPLSITSQVRDAVASLDRDLPLYWVYSLDEAIARPLWFIRVFGTMFMIFGGIALFLAAVGLYAVMAFSVGRRTREVGIRMALGARGSDVVGLIFRQGIIQLGAGLAVGLAMAFGLASVMTIVLFDVQPRDPAIFVGVTAVLILTGVLASVVPARRAIRVDPLVALRAD